VYTTIAAVLHLGNIEFQVSKEWAFYTVGKNVWEKTYQHSNFVRIVSIPVNTAGKAVISFFRYRYIKDTIIDKYGNKPVEIVVYLNFFICW
jgi:myosin heavy subunit